MSEHKSEAKKAYDSKLKRMKVQDGPKGDMFDDVHPFDGVPQLSTTVPAGKMPIGKQR